MPLIGLTLIAAAPLSQLLPMTGEVGSGAL
jgi:hypothetical protein